MLFSWAALKADFRAGFSVFLIAIPLSVGIAVASGAPATAGLIAAIVGGLVGSWISGCRVAINGPAAGLIVTVAAAIYELGAGDPLQGYRAMLGCLVMSGLLQILFGVLRLASLGLSFPKPVVSGMLAAIGLIIVAKQVHILLGVSDVAGSPIVLYMQIPSSVMQLNSAVSVIGALSLCAMLIWHFVPRSWQGLMPGALLAALVGAGVAALGPFSLPEEQFLAVPDSILGAITTPSFTLVGSLIFWKHVIMITLVASAESVLSTCAVDRLTPHAPPSKLNKDLIGKGVVNVICGCIGGLPVITEIVRSSANVSNGAQTQASNFLHGLLLLLFLVTVPELMELEPVSALAAILILTGFRLASPGRLMTAFRHGWSEGAVFVTTIAVILATDLLTGVLAGTLCAVLLQRVLRKV